MAMNDEPLVESGYLRVKDIVGDKRRDPPIAGLLPISASQWWELVKRGVAPRPLRLSPGVTLWRRGEVIAFVESRAARNSSQDSERMGRLAKAQKERQAQRAA